MLQQFGPEIWIADGPPVSAGGFHYGTRMAIIRLSDGSLFVWSPIQLTAGLRAEVDGLGDVRHLIAPNSLHHLFLDDWRRLYTRASLYAPPGLRRKRKDIDFSGDLGNRPIAEWATDIDQVVVPGNFITTEVVFFHRKSATVLFTDLIHNFLPTGFRVGDRLWRDGTSWWVQSRRYPESFAPCSSTAGPHALH
jgi:hypothetical protein